SSMKCGFSQLSYGAIASGKAGFSNNGGGNGEQLSAIRMTSTSPIVHRRDLSICGLLPVEPELRADLAEAQRLGALRGRIGRRVGGQVLADVGDRHLDDDWIGRVAGLVPAQLDDAPGIGGLVEPVLHTG